MADLDRRMESGYLMDFYGPLLTEHRRELLRLYCEEDLSLTEIAEQNGITRQGAHDAITKAQAQLEQYERELGFASRYRRVTDEARACLNQLTGAAPEKQGAEALETAIETLKKILSIER